MSAQIMVSENLKRLRKLKGWSLDKTAQKTGVSKAMLGQIERGESSPTVEKLWQIATGFDVSFSSFVEPSTVSEITSLYRDTAVLSDSSLNEGFSMSVLFPFEAELGFEVYELGLDPNYEHHSQAHSEGVIEHIICISGKLSVFFDNKWTSLIPGQAIRFNAAQPHGYKNTSQDKALFHDIIYYPKR
jgi:transcriptional regulator with XRE-family HTH domain